MQQTKKLSMKNNSVQLLINYEKESYGSCKGIVVSDKKIIVMFFLISFVKHVIPEEQCLAPGA